MEKWFIEGNRNIDIREMAREFNLPEITTKILVNRDITSKRAVDSYLNPSLDRLYDPTRMADLSKAVNILEEKIRSKSPIRIVGDFDVDGISSTYMLLTGLGELGGLVDYAIPNRVEDGYGINKKIIDEAKAENIDTIITCDNGIAAIEEIKYARELGLNIIVTDHHDLPFIDRDGQREEVYVEAHAIVNPKQPRCSYPFKKLCGAGIVYKILVELYKRFNRVESSYKFLEYAAIATICDVVDLVDENRILVKKGLELVNRTENKGLKALIMETGLEDKEIGVYHIGFVIGPSINASGRLDSASKALELLRSDDEDRVLTLAKELRQLNEERKDLTEEGTERVIEQIENSQLKEQKILVVYEPSIHESVAGIIAGRIKDRYHKPTIVLTDGEDFVKGSARSIEAYNMFEELNRRRYLLSHFGGHPMAAGLSLEYENVEVLRKELNKTDLTDDDLLPRIYIDLPWPIDRVDFRLIEELNKLEPFGKGNRKPSFGDRNLSLRKALVLGKNKNVLKLAMEARDGRILEGMIFQDLERFQDLILKHHGEEELDRLYKGLNNNIKLDIIYYPDVNEYMGNRTLQAIIESFRLSDI